MLQPAISLESFTAAVALPLPVRRYYKGVEVTGSPQGVISFLSTTTVACSVDVDQPRAVATLNPVTSLEFTVSRCEFEKVRPYPGV